MKTNKEIVKKLKQELKEYKEACFELIDFNKLDDIDESCSFEELQDYFDGIEAYDYVGDRWFIFEKYQAIIDFIKDFLKEIQ